MKRRDFIAGFAAAASVLPNIVRAQPTNAVRRVAMLVAEANEDDPFYEGRIAGMKEGLRGLGWIEGQNLTLDIHRTSPKAAEVRRHIDTFLAARPDVVVTSGGTTTALVIQATTTVPVVFISAVDPVGAGLIESLAHPGGNVTGFMQFDYSLSGKWLEILKQAAPATVRAGILRDPAAIAGIGQFAVMQSVSGVLGIDVIPISVQDERSIERGIEKMSRSQNAGLIVTSNAAVNAHRELIVKLATQYALPTVCASRIWVDHGGLISYGPDLVASARRAASYVDRVLKGEKPADLPVQAPTGYELVINTKAARQMGLTIPPALLARADEVIE